MMQYNNPDDPSVSADEGEVQNTSTEKGIQRVCPKIRTGQMRWMTMCCKLIDNDNHVGREARGEGGRNIMSST